MENEELKEQEVVQEPVKEVKEDFEKFTEGLEEVIKYIKTNCLKGNESKDNFTDVNFEEL